VVLGVLACCWLDLGGFAPFEPVSDLKCCLGLHFCCRNWKSTVFIQGRFFAFFVWVEAADGYGHVDAIHVSRIG
jgi:hypothetical protein